MTLNSSHMLSTAEFALKCAQPTKVKTVWMTVIVFTCVLMTVILCLHSSPGLCSAMCYTSITGDGQTIYPLPKVVLSKARYLPKCIIIGVKKAGTGALLAYLQLHPDIVTAPEEAKFFCQDKEYKKGLEYYKRKMPYSHEHQLTIEKSPPYFKSPVTPERVYKMNSSIRLVLVVRDPVERAVSEYVQEQIVAKLAGKPQSGPFETTVLDKNGNIKETVIIRTSIYYKHLARWLKYFPLDQIHIVDGDILTKDPVTEIYEVETYLGISHNITTENFVFNNIKGFYCLKGKGDDKCLGKSKGRKHPYVDLNVIKKLKNFYKYKNQKFFNITNKTYNW